MSNDMDPDAVRAAFGSFDGDANGKIDLIEFRELLVKLGVNVEAAQGEALFDVIDSDETGLIDFDEFHAWWSTRQD